MEARYTIRRATPADARAMSDMRMRMFVDMGKPDDQRTREMVAAFVQWVSDAIERGTYLGWVVEDGKDIVASAGMLLIEWPPNRRDLKPQRGYVMNVFVKPEHRRRGLARRMMDAVLAEARVREIRVTVLHASPAGRGLYEQLGYWPNEEMLRIEEE